LTEGPPFPVTAWPATPLANSFWIEPGRLLAGEYPGQTGGEAGSASTRARLDALLGAGITYFIDLTRAGELPPYDHFLPEARADDRYVIYVRRAIDDHGVPLSREAMAETLDFIDRALEVGHQVYVHCRAGIGRTNTVVGCWLRRRGLSGSAALERLNELWLGNARAASWPRVPETPQQARFVTDWLEPGETAAGEPPEPLDLDTARALRDRYLGCLFGLACGDAIGSTLQFRVAGQFTPIADMLGGGQWHLPRGAWTDDTAVALCTAQSLLACHGVDLPDQLRRLRDWQQTGRHSSTGQCIGITAAMAATLAGGTPSDADSAEGLTRAGVAALFGASAPPAAVFEAVSACVGLTHRSAAVLSAARYHAALVLAAVRGASRAGLLAEARDLLGAPGLLALEPGIRRLAAGPVYPDGPAVDGGHSAAGMMQTILWSLGTSAGYRDGLLKMVNLGGDADLRGAVYGQLAGALHGARSLPRTWTGALLRRELLEETADGLLAAALVPHE
jgi:ADP-ribosylglycohydrolase/protein-tyrosine phosphatase